MASVHALFRRPQSPRLSHQPRKLADQAAQRQLVGEGDGERDSACIVLFQAVVNRARSASATCRDDLVSSRGGNISPKNAKAASIGWPPSAGTRSRRAVRKTSASRSTLTLISASGRAPSNTSSLCFSHILLPYPRPTNHGGGATATCRRPKRLAIVQRDQVPWIWLGAEAIGQGRMAAGHAAVHGLRAGFRPGDPGGDL